MCGPADVKGLQLKQPPQAQLKTCSGQDRNGWHNCIGTAQAFAQDHSASWTGRFMNGKEEGEFRTSERFMGQQILTCTKHYSNGLLDGWSDCLETVGGQTKRIRAYYVNGVRDNKAEATLSNFKEYFVYGLIAPNSGKKMERTLARHGIKVVLRGCVIGTEQYAEDIKNNELLIEALPQEVREELGFRSTTK